MECYLESKLKLIIKKLYFEKKLKKQKQQQFRKF